MTRMLVADDYARVRDTAHRYVEIDGLTVSTAARSVKVNGTQVRLTNREFNLLLFFLTHPDTVFSREALLKEVWHWDFGDLSTVTVHVKRLRTKLGDHHRVQTVWGHGYLWDSAAFVVE